LDCFVWGRNNVQKERVCSGTIGGRGPKPAPFRWDSPRQEVPFLEIDERSLQEKHEPKLPIRTNAAVTCVLQYHFRWNFIQHRVPLLSGSELQKFGVSIPRLPLYLVQRRCFPSLVMASVNFAM